MASTPDTDNPSTTAEGALSDSTSGAGTTRNFVLNTRPLFKLMVEKKASDLFFTSNAPIKIKIEGQIMPVNRQILTPDQVRQVASQHLSSDAMTLVVVGDAKMVKAQVARWAERK